MAVSSLPAKLAAALAQSGGEFQRLLRRNRDRRVQRPERFGAAADPALQDLRLNALFLESHPPGRVGQRMAQSSNAGT